MNPPTAIPANHESWGPDPAAFWSQLAAECEKQRSPDAIPTLALEELSTKLTTLPNKLETWTRQPIALPHETDLWIIGDLHGDLLSLRATTSFAKHAGEKENRQVAVCFLGDFF